MSASKETLVTRPGAATSPLGHAPAHRWGDDLALPVGLGGNTFGRTTDADASHRILDAFADAGGVLVDTADTYSDGASEAILGDWMRDRNNRDQMVVSTKGGNHPAFEGLSATTVAAAAEESLRRLGTDYIDLYFAHYQDDQTPIAETAAAFDALVRAGKIRAIGLSNFTTDAVREWIDTAGSNGLAAPVVLQPHFSLVHRQPFEAEIAPLAREAGLAVLPYRALGGGFLSGKYRTEADTQDCARGAGVRPLLTSEGLRLLDTIDAIAREHHVRSATIALAWLMHQPTVTAPLASATSGAQLEELLAAPTITLDQAEITRLNTAADELV
ncbi:aldo/keto reductase [Nocardioides mesophilus]|uniref:Aldo/keto reductase n=2 Tax=Nocardioides mesophilus TaxID=433659 RepID=A0A7G9RGZ8_9ACTN|nr:aldo/keto reductase [Nocardioides mesophilus]QNN54873.1 aldo/keto reductase [Nocardioides mesophilus]